jgi:hypothetical protein
MNPLNVTLRRKAASAMVAGIASMWPAQAHLRDEGRRHDMLHEQLMAAIRGDAPEAEIQWLFEQLEQSDARIAELADQIMAAVPERSPGDAV